jgi:hypothetical protein
MKPTGLLIAIFALAIIANARVPLAPGWIVPVPVVFLILAVAIVGAFAALIVLRLRPYRMPVLPAPSTTPAADVSASRPAVAS